MTWLDCNHSDSVHRWTGVGYYIFCDGGSEFGGGIACFVNTRRTVDNENLYLYNNKGSKVWWQ